MYIRKATPEDADKAAILTRLAIKEIAEVLTGEMEEERILSVPICSGKVGIGSAMKIRLSVNMMDKYLD